MIHYRYKSFITEYNGSLILVGTTSVSTYEDLGLDNGIYYYVITAENEYGISDISNCESVRVITEYEPGNPGYSILMMLIMMISMLAIIYQQKVRPLKSN